MKRFYAIVLILSLLNCKRSNQEVSIQGFAQGTTYHITYVSINNKSLKKSIDSLLVEIDNSLSTYQEESLISKFNRSDVGTQVDHMFIDVFRVAKDVHQLTEGAFNPAMAPIINAWGFGFEQVNEPDSSTIDSLLQFTLLNKVVIDSSKNYASKSDKNIMLDFNAVAQGYSVDIVSQFIENQGIKNYMVEIGGEVRVAGKSINNKWWRIGIDRPIAKLKEREIALIVHLNNKSLATSGNYRSFKEKDGIKYAHTIHPATGYPVFNRLLSATVISNSCADADAYATAFMVLGFEKSKKILLSSSMLEGILIYSNHNGGIEVFITDEMKNFVDLYPNK